MDESFETWSQFENNGFKEDIDGRQFPEESVSTHHSANNFFLELNTSVPNSANSTATRKSSIMSTDKEELLYDWLQSIHMSEYFETFTKNDISFEMLTYLGKSDLKELVFKVGDRIRIENAIRDLELNNSAAWLGSSPTTAMASSLLPAYENQNGEIDIPDHENVSDFDHSREQEYSSLSEHEQQLASQKLGNDRSATSDSVTVKFYTLQNKALHLDVAPSQDIVELVLHSAKVPPGECVSINDGFDSYNKNGPLNDAIFEKKIREFWINTDPNGVQPTWKAGSYGSRTNTPRSAAAPGSATAPSSATTPNSTVIPMTSDVRSNLMSPPADDDDTITLRSNETDAERPTSFEVARNISQFFPNSRHELLAKGLRNSVMLNRRLSTVSRDWRSSVRESKRLSTLKLEDLQSKRASSIADTSDAAEKKSIRDSELDSGLLEQLYHEEMSPTEWLRGKLIGSGSFGSVYLAFNVFSGDILAVKQVQIGGNDQRHKKMLEVLHHEIEMLRTLEHDNIVQYRGFKKEGSFLNIFLEYIPGGSLASKLAFHGAFKEITVKHYISQCLSGLSYLHDKGIIHRDIKGANILVDTYDRVKISDFGLSKRENATKNRISMQGTAFWMAPEVARAKEKTTTKADIWSLGCLIVELITAQHPFPDLQVLQVLYRVGNGERPFIPDDASDELKEVLSRCFVVDPKERASSQELLTLPFFTNESS